MRFPYPKTLVRGATTWIVISLLSGLGLLVGGRQAWIADHGWMAVFSPELRRTQATLADLRRELDLLGVPMIGNTVSRLGFHYPQRDEPPSVAPWVQIDLGQSQPIDAVVIVPALSDYLASGEGVYAFPPRFRIDVSNDVAFEASNVLLVATERDWTLSAFAPVVIPAGGVRARFIRMTVTRLAEIKGRHFFALAEIMVLRGNRNVALLAAVDASASSGAASRWGSAMLTDGISPLGPPIHRRDAPAFDALFAISPPEGGPAWMAVDLGGERTFDELRLHPLHAWEGADVPGYAFPRGFRVEGSMEESFDGAKILFDTEGLDYPNPGNNPVVIRTPGGKARFVRVVATRYAPLIGVERFGLSELEVFSGDTNIALGCRVLRSADTVRRLPRPTSLLTDGRTSFGLLIPLSQWIEEWRRRSEINVEIAALEELLPVLQARATARAAYAGGGLAMVVALGAAVGSIRMRRLRRREREALRTRLAQDLHDEIGSNLAGIAVLAETAALKGTTTPELQEIDRVARETADAMREVLWLVGARQVSGIDLAAHLKLAAARLLPRQEIVWQEPTGQWLRDWPVEARREFFLFFKEALTNIARHARATRVEISIATVGKNLDLNLRDNGRGFSSDAIVRGLGLQSLRARAAALRGTVEISSSEGEGTRVRLSFPQP